MTCYRDVNAAGRIDPAKFTDALPAARGTVGWRGS